VARPLADLQTSLGGQIREPQTSSLPILIHPCQLAVRFDSALPLGKPETNRLTPVNGSNGVKAKPSQRNIQHDGAIIRIEVDVGEFVDWSPGGLASF